MLNRIIKYIKNELAFFKARKAMERQKLDREKRVVNRTVSLICTLRRA